jgi:hypothetical protein
LFKHFAEKKCPYLQGSRFQRREAFLISNIRRVLNIVYVIFGYFPGVRLCFADVSEPSVRSIFKGWMWNIPPKGHIQQEWYSLKMKLTGSLLRHGTLNRNVEGSILVGFIKFFIDFTLPAAL